MLSCFVLFYFILFCFILFWFISLPKESACESSKELAAWILCLRLVFTRGASQFDVKILQLTHAPKVLPKTQLAERLSSTFYPPYPQASVGLDLFLFFAHKCINFNLTSRRLP